MSKEKNNEEQPEVEIVKEPVFNSRADVRAYIFKVMQDHATGKISTEDAMVQHRLVSDVLESYRLEIKAVEVASFISADNEKKKGYKEYLEHIGK